MWTEIGGPSVYQRPCADSLCQQSLEEKVIMVLQSDQSTALKFVVTNTP